jgi:hypothetical protein
VFYFLKSIVFCSLKSVSFGSLFSNCTFLSLKKEKTFQIHYQTSQCNYLVVGKALDVT